MGLIQLKVRGGTVNSSGQNLCRSCASGWVRELDNGRIEIRCMIDEQELHQPVRSCNRYNDKSKVDLNQMYQTARILEVDRRGQIVGFITSKDWYKKHQDDDPDAWRVCG